MVGGTHAHTWDLQEGFRVLPGEVEAEDGLGELVLLQHALQRGGRPSHGQRGVSHAHDPVELGIVEGLGGLVLAQPELLVFDLDALDLEGNGVPRQPWWCKAKECKPGEHTASSQLVKIAPGTWKKH